MTSMIEISISVLAILQLAQYAVCRRNPAQCPSEAEIEAFRQRLTGQLFTPEDTGYEDTTKMLMNTIYNSQFGFVLYATSQEDIVEYVKFIRQFGLRPSIRSSGHDYIGRSAGDNTYHLSLQVFKEISLKLNDPESPTGSSMTMTTGNTWGELYKRADEVRKIVLGGSAQTVTPGGYIQGGGHSPLTPKLGLGVDQVIKFTMVNTDAEVMEVDPNGYTVTRADGSTEYVSDPEVFWAVMGGGGGTFGIVSSYTLKLHDPPEDGFVYVSASYGMEVSGGENRVGELTDKISEVMMTKGDNWGGFLLHGSTSPLPGLFNGSITFAMLHWGGWEEGQHLVEDLFNWHPDWFPTFMALNYSTFWEYEQGVNDALGYRSIIANRFVQPSDLLFNDNLENMYQATLKPTAPIYCTGVMIGGAASEPNPSTSVSPDFRSGQISMTCGTGWESEEDDEFYISEFNSFKGSLYEVGRGVYFNEPDYDLPNWKTDYWGSTENYDSLLAVKQKLDPDNMLWCRNCVGSDLVDFETPCPVTE